MKQKSQQADIDLHGLTVEEAIKKFMAHCKTTFQSGRRDSITLIHGYGSTGVGGRIKVRLRALIEHHHALIESRFNDAANPGATDIRLLGPPPSTSLKASAQEERACSFCTTPKEERKILNKFCRVSAEEIKSLLRGLQARGRLAAVKHSGQKAWQSIAIG